MRLSKLALYCFFVLYLILPEYFALEISGSLPLLTASRVILLILVMCCIVKGYVSFKIDKIFLLYLGVILLVDVYHLTTNPKAAVKDIFSLILEELVVYVVLRTLISSKELVVEGLELIVKSSAIVCVLGLVETITGQNPFFYLTTTKREMLQVSYERLGMVRASASFGHPVYFAVYAVCIVPFAIWFFEKTGKKMYMVIACLNIMGVVASGTRGALFVLALLFIAVIVLEKLVIKLKYVRLLTFVAGSGMIAIMLIPRLFKYVSGLVVSLLGALGITSTEVADFGTNAGGMSSRFMQFTGLTWVKEQDALLLGMGPGAHNYGLISYVNPTSGMWSVVKTVDVGYLAYVFWYGIIGFFAYMLLYYSLIRKAWRFSKKNQKKNIYKAFLYFFIAYLLCLITSVGINSMFIVFAVLMYIYIDLDRKGCVNEA